MDHRKRWGGDALRLAAIASAAAIGKLTVAIGRQRSPLERHAPRHDAALELRFAGQVVAQ
jgi:hypothetical protein